MAEPQVDKLKLALEITGSFEGAGWGGVARNFDGQGLSFGILQWNYGQGTLQKLLLRYQEKHGLIEGFPEDINESARMNPTEAIKFSERMQSPQRVKTEWQDAWRRFGEANIDLQKEMAEPYAKKADEMMRNFGMSSTRAFCFFFDVAVQNGSMKDVKRVTPLDEELLTIIDAAQNNKDVWLEVPSNPEQRVLLKAAWDRSLRASKQWQMDVFYRKGAIAMGCGYVHKKYRSFSFT